MSAPKDEQSEVDQLRADLAATQAELTKFRDRYQNLLMTQEQRHRRDRATLRRAAQEDTDQFAAVYVVRDVEAAMLPLSGLVYRVEQLGEKASAKQVEELKQAAAQARLILEQRREDPPGARLIKDLQAEVSRLRDHVMTAGRGLHAAHVAAGGDVGLGPGELGCVCPGCLLIVGMDDVEVPDERVA